MSSTAPKSVTMPLPVQLSAPEFTAVILPPLSMPKRGPQCTLGSHRVFTLILWGLYTGRQWQCRPVPQDTAGQPALHYEVRTMPKGGFEPPRLVRHHPLKM